MYIAQTQLCSNSILKIDTNDHKFFHLPEIGIIFEDPD